MGLGGRESSQSQKAELSMQVREPRMNDNRASAADNVRKISPSCVGDEKFFSTVVLYEKHNFRLFHCVQPTKIVTLAVLYFDLHFRCLHFDLHFRCRCTQCDFAKSLLNFFSFPLGPILWSPSSVLYLHNTG